MKYILYILVFCFAFCSTSFAQTIEMKKTGLGYKIYQDGKRLSVKQLAKIIDTPNEGAVLMAKAKSNYNLTQGISFVGGALIGWPLGTALGGGEPNWVLAGIGAGLVVLSLPISSKSNSQMKQAIDLYNQNLNTGFLEPRFEPSIGFTGSGFGLSLIF